MLVYSTTKNSAGVLRPKVGWLLIWPPAMRAADKRCFSSRNCHMAPRPMAINTAFCRSNVHAQFGATGVPKTLARRLVNKRSFVALVPNGTTCVECKHPNSFAPSYHSVPGQRTNMLHDVSIKKKNLPIRNILFFVRNS